MGELSTHLTSNTLSALTPIFPPTPLPSPHYHPLPLFDMPTLPQGRLWVLCMFLLSFSLAIYPIYSSPASSIVCSCVVMGISISLLFANKSSMDLYTNSPPNSANKWRQQPGSNPNPNPGPNPNLTPRDEPTYFDADEFQPSEILAIVSSALNWLVATVL